MDARTRPIRTRLRCTISVLCLVLLTAGHAQPARVPEPGVLLVAAERMSDPRFQKTVLLLIEHDQSGSWGVVINKPTPVDVSEILPSVQTPAKIYFGGPVQLDRLLFLYRSQGDDGANGDTGLRGVRWSSSVGLLEKKLASRPRDVRVYAGYAGWAPGQLAFELGRGGWRMIPGRAGNVFSEWPERLWRRLTDALEGLAI